MARPRNTIAGGRFPEELTPHEQLVDEVEHVGDILRPTRRYWVEGEVIVPDWDVEHREVLENVMGLLKSLDLRDETGVPLPGALVLHYQDVAENPRVVASIRRYAHRRLRRYSQAELIGLVTRRPGRTVYQLAEELFLEEGRTPNDQDIAATAGSLRVALLRLIRGELIYSKPVPGTRRVAYYPVNPDPPKRTEVQKMLRGIFEAGLLARGVPANELDLMFQELDEVLRFNENRRLDFWRDPKGRVKPSDPF